MNRVTLNPAIRPLMAAAALTLAALAGCNMFSIIDKPSGDEQLLSAARACLDKGDYECAAEYYGKVSDSEKDIRLAEQAFTTLDQLGVNMGSFISAFVAGSPDGAGFTVMANDLIASGNVSTTVRSNIYNNAYKKALEIENAPLRGLVRFISSVALLSEILAESAGADGVFDQDDIAADGEACAAFGNDSGGAGNCTLPGACDAGIGPGAGTINLDTTEPTGAVSLQMINSVIDQIITALGATEMGAGGSFDSTKSMADAVDLASTQISLAPGCYRGELLKQKFGFSE